MSFESSWRVRSSSKQHSNLELEVDKLNGQRATAEKKLQTLGCGRKRRRRLPKLDPSLNYADAIAHKLEQKCDDNAKLQMDLCKLEEEMSNTVALEEEAQTRANAAEKQLKKTKKDLQDCQMHAEDLEGRLKSLHTTVKVLEEAREDLARKVDAALENLALSSEERDRLKINAEEQRKVVEKLHAICNGQEKQLETVGAELELRQKQLEDAQTSLSRSDSKRTALRGAVEKLTNSCRHCVICVPCATRHSSSAFRRAFRASAAQDRKVGGRKQCIATAPAAADTAARGGKAVVLVGDQFIIIIV